MMKLGVMVRDNVKNKLKLAFIVMVLAFLAMIMATYYMINMVIHPELTYPYAIAYTSSNLYSTLFAISFGMVLFAIYKRYERINDFIRFE